MTSTNRFALLLPLWLLLLFGCGGPKSVATKLSGSVKYKGAPVTAGTITFTAKGEGGEAGGVYLAPINPDGTYSIAQLPSGEFAVSIETESANPNRSQKTYGGPKVKNMQMTSPRPDYAESSQTAQGAYVKIPSKYADPQKSGLTVNLTSGKNIKDFDLTD
jgi:hypothetical protein